MNRKIVSRTWRMAKFLTGKPVIIQQSIVDGDIGILLWHHEIIQLVFFFSG